MIRDVCVSAPSPSPETGRRWRNCLARVRDTDVRADNALLAHADLGRGRGRALALGDLGNDLGRVSNCVHGAAKAEALHTSMARLCDCVTVRGLGASAELFLSYSHQQTPRRP